MIFQNFIVAYRRNLSLKYQRSGCRDIRIRKYLGNKCWRYCIKIISRSRDNLADSGVSSTQSTGTVPWSSQSNTESKLTSARSTSTVPWSSGSSTGSRLSSARSTGAVPWDEEGAGVDQVQGAAFQSFRGDPGSSNQRRSLHEGTQTLERRSNRRDGSERLKRRSKPVQMSELVRFNPGEDCLTPALPGAELEPEGWEGSDIL